MTGHADGRPDADPLTKASNNRKTTAHDSRKMLAELTKQPGSDQARDSFPNPCVESLDIEK